MASFCRKYFIGKKRGHHKNVENVLAKIEKPQNSNQNSNSNPQPEVDTIKKDNDGEDDVDIPH